MHIKHKLQKDFLKLEGHPRYLYDALNTKWATLGMQRTTLRSQDNLIPDEYVYSFATNHNIDDSEDSSQGLPSPPKNAHPALVFSLPELAARCGVRSPANINYLDFAEELIDKVLLELANVEVEFRESENSNVYLPVKVIPAFEKKVVQEPNQDPRIPPKRYVTYIIGIEPNCFNGAFFYSPN